MDMTSDQGQPAASESATTGSADETAPGVGLDQEGYDVVAAVRLTHPRLALVPTLRACPETALEVVQRRGGETAALFVAADTPDRTGFERALVADETVTGPALVDSSDTTHTYRVELADAAVRVTPVCAALDARVLRTHSEGDGWSLRMKLPTRHSLVEFNDRCSDRDVAVDVTQLRRVEDDGGTGTLGVSRDQEELLRTALSRGYYDVPRGVSQNELAEALDISKSAISQRLRRATAEVLSGTVGNRPPEK